MDFFKKNLPILITVAVELVIGLFLLIAPELFTKIVIVVFGIVLIAVGVVFLVRAFANKKSGFENYIAIFISMVALLVGVICTFCVGWVMRWIAFIAVIFGLLLIVSGVFKAKSFFDLNGFGSPVSIMLIVSAVLSFVLGIIIVINPFKAVEALLVFTGIALIVEAAVDIASLVLGRRAGI